jgi:hypothetical protein
MKEKQKRKNTQWKVKSRKHKKYIGPQGKKKPTLKITPCTGYWWHCIYLLLDPIATKKLQHHYTCS